MVLSWELRLLRNWIELQGAASPRVSQAASCIQRLVDVGVQGLALQLQTFLSAVLVSEFPGRSSQTAVATALQLNLQRCSVWLLLFLYGCCLWKQSPWPTCTQSHLRVWLPENKIYSSYLKKIYIYQRPHFFFSLTVLTIFYFRNSSSLLGTIRMLRDSFISKVSQEVISEAILRIFIVDAFNSMRWNSHNWYVLPLFWLTIWNVLIFIMSL